MQVKGWLTLCRERSQCIMHIFPRSFKSCVPLNVRAKVVGLDFSEVTKVKSPQVLQCHHLVVHVVFTLGSSGRRRWVGKGHRDRRDFCSDKGKGEPQIFRRPSLCIVSLLVFIELARDSNSPTFKSAINGPATALHEQRGALSEISRLCSVKS